MDFFGSEILAKRDFFGSMNDMIFLGIVLFTSSNQQQCKHNLLLVWDYFSLHAKNDRDFFGLTNSEVWIFWGIKYEPLSD